MNTVIYLLRLHWVSEKEQVLYIFRLTTLLWSCVKVNVTPFLSGLTSTPASASATVLQWLSILLTPSSDASPMPAMSSRSLALYFFGLLLLSLTIAHPDDEQFILDLYKYVTLGVIISLRWTVSYLLLG